MSLWKASYSYTFPRRLIDKVLLFSVTVILLIITNCLLYPVNLSTPCIDPFEANILLYTLSLIDANATLFDETRYSLLQVTVTHSDKKIHFSQYPPTPVYIHVHYKTRNSLFFISPQHLPSPQNIFSTLNTFTLSTND